MKRLATVLLILLCAVAPGFALVHVSEQYFEKDGNNFAKVPRSAPYIEYFKTATYLTAAVTAGTTIAVNERTGIGPGDHLYISTGSAVLVDAAYVQTTGAGNITLASAVTAAVYSPVILKRDVSASASTDDYQPIYYDPDGALPIIQPYRSDTYGAWSFWIDVGSFGRRISSSSTTTLSVIDDVSYSVQTTSVSCSSCVALTSETSGNYVGTVAAGTAIDVPEADAEGATKTVSWDSTEVKDTTWGAAETLPFTWTFDSASIDYTFGYDSNGLYAGRTDTTITGITAGDTDSQGQVRLSDGSSNVMQIRSATGMSSDFTLILPGDDGTAGQYLKTDGSGTLSWSDALTTIFKSADETIQSDNTLSNDSELQISVAANTTYTFIIKISYNTSAAADFQYTIACPSSPTLIGFETRTIVPGGSAYVNIGLTAACGGAVALTAGAGAGTVSVEGILQNGANAGTLAFQWAQNTSDASNTTVYKGSHMSWKKVN